MSSGPIPDSYWVIPGRLLAGEYPGSLIEAEARIKVRQLRRAGVTFFVDLTEEGELCSYRHLLTDTGEGPAVHRRIPIRDLGTPTRATMEKILNTIDQAIAGGAVVYVHCWGGIGRTGTVVGCYLVRHGMTGEAALHDIARLRRGIPDSWRPSPETEGQRQMVRKWPARQPAYRPGFAEA